MDAPPVFEAVSDVDTVADVDFVADGQCGHRSVQRMRPGGMFERLLVLGSCQCARNVERFVQILKRRSAHGAIGNNPPILLQNVGGVSSPLP